MFKRLLVPIDLSDRNERTLRTALGLARQSGARVTLLHVIYRIGDGELRAFYQRLMKASARKLDLTAKPFAARGIRVSAEALIGEPAVEIVRAAARLKADLIVMGSHKVNPRRRTRGWGTTSYKVGMLCQCPILLVK